MIGKIFVAVLIFGLVMVVVRERKARQRAVSRKE